jgi:hypothetical protein
LYGTVTAGAYIPSCLLAQEEVRIVYTKAHLVSILAKILVAQGLERCEEEGRRRGEMRYSQTNVGDGHSMQKRPGAKENRNKRVAGE